MCTCVCATHFVNNDALRLPNGYPVTAVNVHMGHTPNEVDGRNIKKPLHRSRDEICQYLVNVTHAVWVLLFLHFWCFIGSLQWVFKQQPHIGGKPILVYPVHLMRCFLSSGFPLCTIVCCGNHQYLQYLRTRSTSPRVPPSPSIHLSLSSSPTITHRFKLLLCQQKAFANWCDGGN